MVIGQNRKQKFDQVMPAAPDSTFQLK